VCVYVCVSIYGYVWVQMYVHILAYILYDPIVLIRNYLPNHLNNKKLQLSLCHINYWNLKTVMFRTSLGLMVNGWFFFFFFFFGSCWVTSLNLWPCDLAASVYVVLTEHLFTYWASPLKLDEKGQETSWGTKTPSVFLLQKQPLNKQAKYRKSSVK
jgi:hypothetical protein